MARAIITRPSLLLADEPTGVRAASTAGRVLFIKDGEVFHQLYRGGRTEEQFYQEISGTLTLLATGGMEQ